MRNRIGECCVFASLYDTTVQPYCGQGCHSQLFPHWDVIDPRGARILICKCSRCFSDYTRAKISSVKIFKFKLFRCLRGPVQRVL